MAQIFPRWTNRLPQIAIVAILLGIVSGVLLIWYYGSPKFTDVGFQPAQPIPFSHPLHADTLGMDCRYCHSMVERSPHANIPTTQQCMNCHQLVATDKPSIAPLLKSWETNTPVQWKRVHKIPDYAYFNHSAHLAAGVACISCHGDVTKMTTVAQAEPLSMSWCLDCHRNPAPNLRPPDQVTNMKWKPPANQPQWVSQFMADKKIKPPVDCSGCHR